MLNKLQAICNKYEELCARSEQPDFYADPQKAAKQLREKGYLEVIITAENKKMLQERLIQLKEAFPDSMEEIFYKKAEEIILKLQEPEQD